MLLEFPKDRTLSRAAFIGMVRRQYPMVSRETVKTVVTRKIEPIRVPGRYNQYGFRQWWEILHYFENRSTVVQRHREKKFLEKKSKSKES